MRALAALAGAVVSLAVQSSALPAVAQEYGESRGPLTVGQFLELAGDGFSPDSAVKVQLRNPGTGETIDLGTLTSDDAGRLTGSARLPEGLPPGTYSLEAIGVTSDGATRILSAGLETPGAAGEQTPCEPAGGVPVSLLVLLPLLGLVLMAGGWWAARRHRERQPEAPGAEPGAASEATGPIGRWRWSRRREGDQ